MNTSFLRSQDGFTLPELIVAITIIVILSWAAFISYSNYTIDARDSARKSDMGSLKVALQSAKLKRGSYPAVTGSGTTNLIRSTQTGMIIATQGLLRNDLALGDANKTYLDPKSKLPYIYSTTTIWQDYEIGMTLENAGSNLTALTDGQYIRVLTTFPALLVATTSGSLDIDTGVGPASFIVNGSIKNIPYNYQGVPQKSAASLAEILGSEGFTTSAGYTSCQAVYEAGRASGSGTYMLRNSSWALTQTGCTMQF